MSDPGRAHEDQRTWDKWYGTGSRWSGRPNRALVDEATGLEPGTALDVGCGEGADAIWLASRGWLGTGMDPSMVALDRARAAAAARSARITWVRAGIQDLPPDISQHDLVIAMYAVLRQTDDGAGITALLEAGLKVAAFARTVTPELTALGEACLTGALRAELRAQTQRRDLSSPDELPVSIAIRGGKGMPRAGRWARCEAARRRALRRT
jgi:SAM-dependent methyltransferase